MRLLSLAVLGLVLGLALPGGPAFAAAERHAGKAPSRVAQAARPAATHAAQMQRSAPLRGQVGVARDARAASASTAIGQRRPGKAGRAAPMRWAAGLPAPALVQANECPDGTMATLARGHDDIVRCMPL